MKCPYCKTEAIIDHRELLFTGDTSDQEETKAFYLLHFYCRNKQCTHFQKEIAQKQIEIQ